MDLQTIVSEFDFYMVFIHKHFLKLDMEISKALEGNITFSCQIASSSKNCFEADFTCFADTFFLNRIRTHTNKEDPGSIPGRIRSTTLKMVLDATLLNTQHYKVRIKGKSGTIQGKE